MLPCRVSSEVCCRRPESTCLNSCQRQHAALGPQKLQSSCAPAHQMFTLPWLVQTLRGAGGRQAATAVPELISSPAAQRLTKLVLAGADSESPGGDSSGDEDAAAPCKSSRSRRRPRRTALRRFNCGDEEDSDLSDAEAGRVRRKHHNPWWVLCVVPPCCFVLSFLC